MKKVLLIDNDKFYSDLYRTAFEVRTPQMEYHAIVNFAIDLLPEIKKIKPDVIMVSLENQIEFGMGIIKTIRQTEEIKNTIIAAFVNSWANDYSPEALKALGVVELWDRIDMAPKQVIERISTLFMTL